MNMIILRGANGYLEMTCTSMEPAQYDRLYSIMVLNQAPHEMLEARSLAGAHMSGDSALCEATITMYGREIERFLQLLEVQFNVTITGL
jgi:hypothetical protein